MTKENAVEILNAFGVNAALELNALKTVEMVVEWQGNTAPPAAHHHVGLPLRRCGVLQLPGLHHHPVPPMGTEHRLHHQEGSAEDVPPETAEEVQPDKDRDGALLRCRRGVRPLLLHQRIIRSAERTIGCNRLSLQASFAIMTNTSRHNNCFFPSAVGFFSKAQDPH